MKQKLIRKKFFNYLYLYSLSFIKENDTNKINSISYIKKILLKRILIKKDKFINFFPKKNFKIISETSVVGMNTVGLLLDRLTILSLKINLLNKKKNFKTTDKVKIEIRNIILALASAGSIKNLDYQKITKHKFKSNSKNFRECFFELLYTNLLLWESQETLYNKNILKIKTQEIKDYIKFFSELNIKRNILITKIENYYWKKKW
jgi:hypothetical protein